MSNGGIYDHYELLGVTPAATSDEINAAYRTLAKRLHPDVVGEASTALFAMVADARAVLTDPERRARYDRARSRPLVPRRTAPRRPPEPDVDDVDDVAEDVPPRPPPPPTEESGPRASSYPPPTYQTYFGRSGSYPPPTYQAYFGRPGSSWSHGPYTQSSRQPPGPSPMAPPKPLPRSPGRLLAQIVRGVAKATGRYTNRAR